jgi:hypothetical protein
VKVYTASKLHRAPVWEAERTYALDHNVFFHARWLNHIKLGTPDTAKYAAVFWKEDIDDVAMADYIIVLAYSDDLLRGALVEVGAALLNKTPVIIVTDKPDDPQWGTWQYHPLVLRKVTTVREALQFIVNH